MTDRLANLRTHWSKCWRGIGAAIPGEPVLEALLAAYAEPQRHYHTLQHLDECISLLEQYLGLALHPNEVGLALWFHDAVYDVKAKDNELRSADWAARILTDAGIAAPVIERIRDLVLATRHAALPEGADQQLLVDVDLSILGAARERFIEYEAQVRREYHWVPDILFRRKRREILQTFLERQPLYQTAALRQQLEDRARDNLRWSLANL